jgi:flagellar biosynthesis protein FliQ
MNLNIGDWVVTLSRKMPGHFSTVMLVLGLFFVGLVVLMMPAFLEALEGVWAQRLMFSPTVLAESVLAIALFVLWLSAGMASFLNALLMLPRKR